MPQRACDQVAIVLADLWESGWRAGMSNDEIHTIADSRSMASSRNPTSRTSSQSSSIYGRPRASMSSCLGLGSRAFNQQAPGVTPAPVRKSSRHGRGIKRPLTIGVCETGCGWRRVATTARRERRAVPAFRALSTRGRELRCWQAATTVVTYGSETPENSVVCKSKVPFRPHFFVSHSVH